MENIGICMTIWNILLPFDIIYGRLVEFGFIWYIVSRFECFDQEKSGNPDHGTRGMFNPVFTPRAEHFIGNV
jgi:hypothetical protein